jgi:Predicted solute binding protein
MLYSGIWLCWRGCRWISRLISSSPYCHRKLGVWALLLIVRLGAYITIITVSVHSTVVLSTVTYSTKPQDTSSTSTSRSSSTTSPHSSMSTTNDGLAPPARPTNLSTVTSATRGSDVCPTGFYACSAVYQGGCCRTGRVCDTTSCPTTSSTTIISDGVTIEAPVATTTQHSGGNRCAQGWFHCADTVGGGCCPTGFACGASCTARDITFGTTLAKEQATATSSDGVMCRVSKMMLGMMLGMSVGVWILWKTKTRRYDTHEYELMTTNLQIALNVNFMEALPTGV